MSYFLFFISVVRAFTDEVRDPVLDIRRKVEWLETLLIDPGECSFFCDITKNNDSHKKKKKKRQFGVIQAICIFFQ